MTDVSRSGPLPAKPIASEKLGSQARPRLRYRIGRPILRFVFNQILDRWTPDRLSRWYSNASTRVRSFLFFHGIYTPSESAPRHWDLPLICGKSIRLSDEQDRGLRQLALGYGLLDRVVTQAIVQILRTDQRPWFIDAGANIGHMSIDALALGKSVLAIEPDTSAAESLGKLLKTHALGRKHLCRAALSSARGKANFEYVPYGDLNRLSVLPTVEGLASKTVDTIDLDGLVEDVGISMSDIALIKMDIEGGEPDAIAGACRLLEIGKPSLIVELLNLQTRVEIARSLINLGYSLYVINKSQKPLFRAITLDDAARSHDWNYCFFQPAMIKSLTENGSV